MGRARSVFRVGQGESTPLRVGKYRTRWPLGQGWIRGRRARYSGDMEQALLSRDLKAWLAENHIEPLDIISKLHLLLHKETDERKRHFGFQYRSKAMAFHIVYIDKFAWSKGKYRERKTGENQRKVQRMLHLFMFDEIHRSKSQRLKIVKDMMLEPETAGELA